MPGFVDVLQDHYIRTGATGLRLLPCRFQAVAVPTDGCSLGRHSQLLNQPDEWQAQRVVNVGVGDGIPCKEWNNREAVSHDVPMLVL